MSFRTLSLLTSMDKNVTSTLPSMSFPASSNGKKSACNPGDLGLIPGVGRSSGGGNGYQLQYSCLENIMARGSWWAIVHGVAKNHTLLSSKLTSTLSSESPTLSRLISLLVRGSPRVLKHFLLHSSLPGVQVQSWFLSLSLSLSLFSFPLQVMGKLSGLRSSASVQ